MSNVLFRLLFPYCMSEDCLPALSPRAAQCLWALFQQSPLTFKIPCFLLPEVIKFSSSYFPSQFLWGFVFPCALSSVLICLLPFFMTVIPPPSVVVTTHFSPKPYLCSFYLLSYGLSLPLVVEFALSLCRKISQVFRVIS